MYLSQRLKHAVIGGVASTVAFTGLVAAPAAALAAEGTTIAPLNTVLNQEPGTNTAFKIQVMNGGSTAQTYTMEVYSFMPTNDEGGVVHFPSQKDDLSGWVTVNPRTVTVEPGRTADVTAQVRVPTTARPGGHYATVFASTRGTKPGTSGMAIGYGVGSNLLVNVKGDVVESAQVLDFSMPNARVVPGEPLYFNARVRNKGNTHVMPKGMVEIFRGDIKMDEIKLNEGAGYILPDSARKFMAMSNKTLTPGQYTAKLTLSIGEGKYLPVDPINFVVIGETSLAAIVATILGIFVLILLAALMVNRKPAEAGNGRR